MAVFVCEKLATAARRVQRLPSLELQSQETLDSSFNFVAKKCVVALALHAKDYSGRNAFTKTKGKNDWSVSILFKPEM